MHKTNPAAPVPCIFNVVNGTDAVYYGGKYMHAGARHPGVPVLIDMTGLCLVRPTFVETSLSHFVWKESVLDHLTTAYQAAFSRVIDKTPALHNPKVVGR